MGQIWPSKTVHVDAKTREALAAAVKQDIIAAIDRRMQPQQEYAKQKTKSDQESVDAMNKKIEVVHERLHEAHELLRTDVNDLENKVKVLKLETEKAEKERRKTDSGLKKLQLEIERESKKAEEQRKKLQLEIERESKKAEEQRKKLQLEMERENKKSNNELEKLKLVLKLQQGEIQLQREMKELERESRNEMQVTVNQIKELRELRLTPEQFDKVLQRMIPAAPLPSLMPDEVDNEFPIGTEELDREEDIFVDGPRPDYPSNWVRRRHTEPIRPHHSHTAPMFLRVTAGNINNLRNT